MNTSIPDFLISALTTTNEFMDTQAVQAWVAKQNKEVVVNVKPKKLAELTNWHFDAATGDLVHDSGKFFSIVGIDIKTNWGKVSHWQQPIINQPEIGFLGIIVKKFNGILYFLMQAKIEPGNINYVQLSPTLQATKSNYTKVHQGKSPLFLDYFNGTKPSKVLIDQLQSEQGARFLRKRNRNIIVEVTEDLEVPSNFVWLTLGQIKELLKFDNLVNMDTRTVISCINFGTYSPEVTDFYHTLNINKGKSAGFELDMLISALSASKAIHTIDRIISWVTNLKSTFDLEVTKMPLKDVQFWKKDEYQIFHEAGKYFKVIGVEVEIGNREVQSWCQPLVESAQEGIMAFIVKKINGTYHFLVQAKLESGNFDVIEMAPTVQCLTGNYREGQQEYIPAFLDYVLNAKPEQIKLSSYQSEEGGRFFQEQNRNMIIEADDQFPIEVPENFIWMTLNQMLSFIQYNNYLNVEARSLISCVRFV
jgi:oxidase EvaA